MESLAQAARRPSSPQYGGRTRGSVRFGWQCGYCLHFSGSFVSPAARVINPRALWSRQAGMQAAEASASAFALSSRKNEIHFSKGDGIGRAATGPHLCGERKAWPGDGGQGQLGQLAGVKEMARVACDG